GVGGAARGTEAVDGGLGSGREDVEGRGHLLDHSLVGDVRDREQQDGRYHHEEQGGKDQHRQPEVGALTELAELGPSDHPAARTIHERSLRTAKYSSSRPGSWGTTRVRRTPAAASSAMRSGTRPRSSSSTVAPPPFRSKP